MYECIIDKILFLILVLFATTVKTMIVYKQCSDCVVYIDCPHLVIDETNLQSVTEEIRKVLCGRDVVGGTELVKVCCSAFDPINTYATSLPTSCGVSMLAQDSRTRYTRVVNGKFARLYEFPWMAMIKMAPDKFWQPWTIECGGSVINDRYILTAAHCVKNHEIKVGLGYLDFSYDSDCDYIQYQRICEQSRLDLNVETKIVHPNYNSTSLENDIALLRVEKSIRFGRTIVPICLPTTPELRESNLLGESATIAGWGITETGRQSPRLKKTIVPIKTCTSYNRRNIICAGGDGWDSCNGDSGSPLFIETTFKNEQRHVQIGITSFGSHMCGTTTGVYTDVRKFMDWILENINR